MIGSEKDVNHQSESSSPGLLLELLEKRCPLSTGFARLVKYKPGLVGRDFATKSVETNSRRSQQGKKNNFDGDRILWII